MYVRETYVGSERPGPRGVAGYKNFVWKGGAMEGCFLGK